MDQLCLQFPGRPSAPGSGSGPGSGQPELGAYLSGRLGKPVTVVLTRNRSTMISWRAKRDGMQLRLHRAFAQANEQEREALAAYVADRDPEAGRLLDKFLARNLKEAPPREVVARPRGRFHDLQQIFVQLNRQFFHDACQARITWGQAGSRRRRRSIQLGCYVANERMIRIHPSLDQAFVPVRYVAWVVFHEMLHEVFGVERRGRRRKLHPPEFGALEASYPGFRECKAWEEQHLPRLLSYRPTTRQGRRGRGRSS